ncbi:MAG: ROK family protein [Pseudomonadota bacterium]
MIAVGIDLGGTKIEAQIFDADWTRVAQRRIDTPRDYPGLVAAMADQIAWAGAQGGPRLPVGIAAAGLVNPATGLALTANLAATGHPFPADIAATAGRRVSYVNDCRALTLSEAIFGAARGLSPAVGLILGTGIGGGVAVEGRLVEGPATLGGEFGHFAIAGRGPWPAHRHLRLRAAGLHRDADRGSGAGTADATSDGTDPDRACHHCGMAR